MNAGRHQPGQTRTRRLPSRRFLFWAGVLVTLLVLGVQFSAVQQEPWVASDFVEYWAAGRLHASGGNPYGAKEIAALQQEIGYIHREPMMMWNPPGVLALVMPFGLIGYPMSRLLWLLANLGLVLFCAYRLWYYFGGRPERAWLAPLIALTFVPTVLVLMAGQISVLILVGLVGFLLLEDQQRWFRAGLSSALVLIKPQLLYLFWIAVAFWIVARRRWSVLAGAASTVLVTTAIAVVVNPSVIEQYLSVLQQPSYFWITPTIGANLRLLFGWEKYWLQFLPSLLGALWFVVYWRRHGNSWCWKEHVPVVLLASAITTSFGWLFDDVVLLLIPIQIAIWLHGGRRSLLIMSLAFYLLINGLAVYTHLVPTLAFEWAAAHGGDLTGDGWGLAASILQPSRAWGALVAPLLAVWYWLVRSQVVETQLLRERGLVSLQSAAEEVT